MVIDCSGSMGGDPIQQAKEAALFFVKDLPTDGSTMFNIVLFGSNWTLLSPSGSMDCTAASVAAAVPWIQRVDADHGGTNILGTLEHIYQQPLPAGVAERQVIFLTDGGISGLEQQGVFELVDPNAGPNKAAGPGASTAAAATTVLCLGIGHGVHRDLLDGIASRTGGVVQYVVASSEITNKCGFLKKCALSGEVLTQPRLAPRACLLRMAPAALPPRIFAGEPLHVLFEVVRAEPGAAVVLSAKRASDGSAIEVALPLDGAPAPGQALAPLHAMAYIACLLNGTSALHLDASGAPVAPPPSGETVKAAVVRLAVEEGLVTPYTSAVGVMLQRDPLDPAKTTKYEVPLKVRRVVVVLSFHDEMRFVVACQPSAPFS